MACTSLYSIFVPPAALGAPAAALLQWIKTGSSLMYLEGQLAYVDAVALPGGETTPTVHTPTGTAESTWDDVLSRAASLAPEHHMFDTHTDVDMLAQAVQHLGRPTTGTCVQWAVRAHGLTTALGKSAVPLVPTVVPRRRPVVRVGGGVRTATARRGGGGEEERKGTDGADVPTPPLFLDAYTIAVPRGGTREWGSGDSDAAFVVVYRGEKTRVEGQTAKPGSAIFLQLRKSGSSPLGDKAASSSLGLPGGLHSSKDGANPFATAHREMVEEGWNITRAQFAQGMVWAANVQQWSPGATPPSVTLDAPKPGTVDLQATPTSVPGCEPVMPPSLPPILRSGIVVVGLNLSRAGIVPPAEAPDGASDKAPDRTVWDTDYIPGVLTPETVASAPTAHEVDTRTVALGGVWVSTSTVLPYLLHNRRLRLKAKVAPYHFPRKVLMGKAFQFTLACAAAQLPSLVCPVWLDGFEHSVTMWHATTAKAWASIQADGHKLRASTAGMQGPGVYCSTKEGAKRFVKASGVLLQLRVTLHHATLQRRTVCPCGVCGKVGVDHLATASAYSDATIVLPALCGHATNHGVEVVVYRPEAITIVAHERL